MKSPGTFSLLDLRLILIRQPMLAFLLFLIVLATFWVLAHPPQEPPSATEMAVDPARIIAAQRNFRNILIAPDSLAAAQQELHANASSHHLTIGQVDYEHEADTTGGFSQVSMRLPVTGRYDDFRAFIDSALASQPAMSIRHLTIQRNTNADAQANSSVTATLTAQFLLGAPVR